jgi:hypothetical protein
MKLKNSIYIKRTKELDNAVTNIQKRMNQFKNEHKELFFDPDYNTDFALYGKTWKMLENAEYSGAVFDAGNYKVDTDQTSKFVVHYDTINQKIKDIYIVES